MSQEVTSDQVETTNDIEPEEMREGEIQGDEQKANVINWYYDFSQKLRLRYAVDVASSNPDYLDNSVKSIRMAPNGCSYIYSTEDGMIRYVDLRDVDFWNYQAEIEDQQGPISLQNMLQFSHTEVVYGMDWVPRVDAELFVSSCKDTPIRLWDVLSGKTSLYKTYDHLDQVMSALSCHVLRDGMNMLGGYRNSIRSFDLDRPGCEQSKISVSGIVSSIDDDYSSCIAFSTYDGSVSLMDSRLLGYENAVSWSIQMTIRGVHEVRLLNNLPLLFINERYTGDIHCFDRRRLDEPLYTLHRTSNSQQKLEISLSAHEQWIASGSTDGIVSVWNTVTGELTYQQRLYADSIPCAAFHLYNPLLVCGTGQRHFGEEAVPSCCLLYQVPWNYGSL